MIADATYPSGADCHIEGIWKIGIGCMVLEAAMAAGLLQITGAEISSAP